MNKAKIKILVLISLIILFGISIALTINAFDWGSGYGNHSIGDLLPLNYSDFEESADIAKKVDNYCRRTSGNTLSTAGLSNSGAWGFNSICIEEEYSDDSEIVNGYYYHVLGILSLSADGSGVVHTYSGNDKSVAASETGKDMAFLCYVATTLRDSGASYDGGSGDGLKIMQAGRYIWETKGYHNTISSAIGISVPGSAGAHGTQSAFDYFKNDDRFKNAYGNCTGKVVILGLGQSKLFLYGNGEPQPTVEITKYIKNVESTIGSPTAYEGIIGASREPHKDDDDWKKSNKPKIEENAIVTYEIEIKNKGDAKAEGTFSDTFDSNLEFVEAKFSDGTAVNKDGQEIVLENKDDKKTILVKLKATNLLPDSFYTNTAKFKYKDSEDTEESSDYFEPMTEDIKIDKYTGGRSGKTDEWKEQNPFQAGSNESEHIISYTIVIKNEGSKDVTGTFTDWHEPELLDVDSTVNSGDEVLVKAGQSVTITYRVKTEVNITAEKYMNTAKFKWTSAAYGELEIESSEWIEIKGPPPPPPEPPKGDIVKYITEVNGTPVVAAYSGRKSMGYTTKDGTPVEVEKGDVVTYRIEMTDRVWYQNHSAKNYCNGGGSYCHHYNKHNLDWMKCTDTIGEGLQYLSYEYIQGSGNDSETEISGNTIKFHWDNVNYGSTVIVDLKATVTSSNMRKMNLENKVGEMKYQFTWYDCRMVHVYRYCGSKNCSGHHQRQSCYFSHPTTTVNEDHDFTDPYTGTYYNGLLGGEDSDFVRLRDPIVKGMVWLDEDTDGLKNGSEGISSMGTVDSTRTEHQGISVELWNATENRMIERQTVASDGSFDFGRVKKGTGDVGDAVPDNHIPEDTLKFKYTNDDLYNYYLIYNYDGERYEVTINAGTSRLGSKMVISDNNYLVDSNADEIGRTEFNNSLETISNNKAYAGTTGSASSKDLAYTEEGSGLQSSILYWDGNLGTQTTANVTMKAQSFTFYLTGGIDGDETEYLKYINCGFIVREAPDLSLTKDAIKADVTINNHITTYEYGSLGTDPYVKDSNNVLAEPYLLSLYREDYEYRTAKYNNATIIDIVNENNSYKNAYPDSSWQSIGEYLNDLNVVLTFKITITNNSPSCNAVIREIIDYSAEELEILPSTVKVGTTPLTVSTSTGFSNPGYSGSIYDQNFFTGDGLTGVTLAPGDSVEVFASYYLERDGEGYLKVDDSTDETADSKMNIAEIGAYSFYDGTTPAGLVDRNSNPGNIDFPGGKANPDKFEDDTFETGVVVALKDLPPPPPGPGGEREKYYYRNISGVVFEEIDRATNSTSDGQLVGNGKKDNNDIFAKNVIAKLYEVIQKKDGSGNVTEEYYIDTGAWYRTSDDGRYYFGDKTTIESNSPRRDTPGDDAQESTDESYKIHAGVYVVRFVYGDEAKNLVTEDGATIRYSGQDYQSVKYTDVAAEGTSEDAAVRPSAFTDKSGNSTQFSSGEPAFGDTILSVAKDNEIRRLEVNEYSTTTTYPMDTILKAKRKESGDVSPEQILLAQHTAMFADTRPVDLDIEYCDNYVSLTDFTMDGKVKEIEKFYYSVRDVNFGLIQRPITKLQLMNDITEVRAITSDGNTLIDILFDVEYRKCLDEKGNLVIYHTTTVSPDSIGISNVQVLDRVGHNQGFRYVNVDTDLLQGMTITIKFRNAVANISEVDHLAKWLEDKISSDNYENHEGTLVDLDVTYTDTENDTLVSYPVANSDKIVIDQIGKQKREYNYENSYLYKLLSNGDSSKGITAPRNSNTGEHNYDGGNSVNKFIGSSNIKKIYTYANMKNKSHADYRTGYYLGEIYYTNTASVNESKVKTRVDQYIDYVDNDLIFKPEENINANQQITYLTYTPEEIAKRGLMRDITPDVTVISDGKKDYYNKDSANTNNNLAFNIEDKDVNADFYRFLIPISKDNDLKTKEQLEQWKKSNDPQFYSTPKLDANLLYNIDLQASRILTSELDLEGVELDNIAEIIKATNTAGRKVYVKASNTASGYLGNTTKEPIESVNKPGSTTSIVDIAELELDTDFSEYITFSPPTGLDSQDSIIKTITEKTGNVLLILIPVIIIIVGMSYVTVKVVKRKKFYK